MKKFVKVLSLVFVLGALFGVVACTKKTSNAPTATKEKPGQTTSDPTVTVPHVHSYEGEYQKDSTDHWKVCSCGATNKEAHNFGSWTYTVDPTADSGGERNRTCSVCGYVQTETTAPATVLAAPVCEIDPITGEITWDDVENATGYKYQVSKGRYYSNKSDWLDIPADGLYAEWGENIQVKAVSTDKLYLDSLESAAINRYYTNSVVDGEYIGYLDSYQPDPHFVVTYNEDTHVNHVKFTQGSDYNANAIIALVSGNTDGFVCKITISNLVGDVTASKIVFKWNDVEDSVNWSNYMKINRTGTNAYMFKKNWVEGQGTLTSLPIMIGIEGGETNLDIEFDLVMKWEKIETTEKYEFDKDTSKVVYTKTYMDTDYHANETKELAVETKTLAELKALDATAFESMPDYKDRYNDYSKLPYLVTGYVSEIQGGTDKYGNMYLVDESLNSYCIYGLQALNSGAMGYQLKDDQLQLKAFYNTQKFQDIVNDFELGAKVTILAQVELYGTSKTFEILGEVVEIDKTNNLQSLNKSFVEGLKTPHLTATFDKASYNFNDDVVMNLTLTSTEFEIGSVKVVRQSKNTSYGTITLTADTTDPTKYTFKAGVADTVEVTLNFKYAISSSFDKTTGKVTLTYSLKEGQTGEVPAADQIALETLTVQDLASLPLNKDQNVYYYDRPFILTGFIKGYSKGNGTIYAQGTDGKVYEVALYGGLSAGTYEFERADHFDDDNENEVVKYVRAVKKGDNKESLSDYTYISMIAVLQNYYGKAEVSGQFIEVISDAPTAAAVSMDIDDVVEIDYAAKVVENQEDTLIDDPSTIEIGDKIKMHFDVDESYSLEVGIQGLGETKATAIDADTNGYYVFTVKFGDKLVVRATQGYSAPQWGMLEEDDKLYYAKTANKLETNENPDDPAVKIIAKYLVNEKSISETKALAANSTQLILLKGYAVEVVDSQYGNFYLVNTETVNDNPTDVYIQVYGTAPLSTGLVSPTGKGIQLKENPTADDYLKGWDNPKTFKQNDTLLVQDGQYVEILCFFQKSYTEVMCYLISSSETNTLQAISAAGLKTFPKPTFAFTGKAAGDDVTRPYLTTDKDAYNYGETFSFTVTVKDGFEITEVSLKRKYGLTAKLTATDGVYSFTIGVDDKVTVALKDLNEVEPAATFSFSSLDNGEITTKTSAKVVWVQNGITFTNNKADSSTGCTNNNGEPFTNPIRLYKNQTCQIDYTGMTSIKFDCGSDSYAETMATSTFSTGTAVQDGKYVILTFTSATNTVSFTVPASFRISSFAIYA